MHKSGFINILGKPNVGKSSLVNAIIKEKVAIVSNKEQTTRHRIFGILNDDNYQLVFSDTPGIIEPKYELQKKIVAAAKSAIKDADIFLWVVDCLDQNIDFELLEKMKKNNLPIYLLLNKSDLLKSKDQEKKIFEHWKKNTSLENIIFISAKNCDDFQFLINDLLNHISEHPAFFPKDVFTDKNERFYVSETIRQKIFENYHEEIPYSTEVVVENFKEEENIIKISTTIYVERDSQKPIIIGKGASAIKKISTEARMELENFFGKKIFLEQFVKVSENWRHDKKKLNQFGYH